VYKRQPQKRSAPVSDAGAPAGKAAKQANAAKESKDAKGVKETKDAKAAPAAEAVATAQPVTSDLPKRLAESGKGEAPVPTAETRALRQSDALASSQDEISP
jgi:hypothetical protein